MSWLIVGIVYLLCGFQATNEYCPNDADGALPAILRGRLKNRGSRRSRDHAILSNVGRSVPASV
jgi:hypothetical protein